MTQAEWIASTKIAGAAFKETHALLGAPKSMKVPRGTARNRRRQHLQMAYLKRQCAAAA